MHPEATTPALLHLRLTHQVPFGALARGGDALAVVEGGPLPVGRRVFVPGLLPCGECPACRRALCSACSHLRRVVASADAGAPPLVELPERFVVALDDEDNGRPATTLIAAGLVADVIGAAGRAGLGPGDTAIWIGQQPRVRVGASWSVRRGCRTFWRSSGLLSSASSPSPSAAAPATESSPQAIELEPGAGAQSWNVLIAEAEAAGGPAGGRPERRLFICGPEPELAEVGISLATPGSTLSFLMGAPAAILGLDNAPPVRLFTGSGSHPDLVTEALAALRRGQVDVQGTFVEIPFAAVSAAQQSFQTDDSQPIPVLVFDR
jgi:hypothetical protein